MKIRDRQFANFFLLITLISFLVDLGQMKYSVALISALLLFVLLLRRKEFVFSENLLFLYEFKQLLMILFVFLTLTIIKQLIYGFNIYAINECIYYITPLFLVFFYVQFQKKPEDIFHIIDIIFYIYITRFFLENWSILSLSGIKSISLRTSYSPYESGMAFVFCALSFYCLYRKDWKKGMICVLFSYFTLKRVAFMATVANLFFLFFWRHKKIYGRKVRKIYVYLSIIFFILLPMIIPIILTYSFADSFYAITGFNISAFTKGRFERLILVTNSNEINTGWGSVTTFLTDYLISYHKGTLKTNFNLHNDIYKIYLEMGFIGTAAFTISFFKLTRKNLVSFIFCFYLFTEMCVNHLMGAGSPSLWIIYYLLFFCFNSEQAIQNDNNAYLT